MDWARLAPWNWFSKEGPPPPGAEGAAGDGARDGAVAEVERWLAAASGLAPGVGAGAGGSLLRPRLDISEDRRAYKIDVEVPGVDREDVTLVVEGDALVIRGEKRAEREHGDEFAHCVERSYGAFSRVLTLPDDADADHIDARFRRGVLRIRIPKHQESAATGRRIEIGE